MKNTTTEKRKISEVYVIHPVGSDEIIKICSNFKLASHYRELLSPHYQECKNTTLTIDKYNLIHFTNESIEISEEEYITELKKLKEKLDIIRRVLDE